jgi:hypothetical protein
MAFHLNTRGIHTLRTYADAVKHEESIKPIRGSHPPLKPLGPRNKQHVNIRKGGNNEIIVCLYATDVATYHEDGRIEVCVDVYSTQSTHALLSAVLGVWVSGFDGGTWVSCEAEGVKGYFPLKNGKGVFRRDENSASRYSLIYENPVFPTRRTLNRKKHNEVRKSYAGFIKYFDSFFKLTDRGERIDRAYCGMSYASFSAAVLSDDLDKWYEAALGLRLLGARNVWEPGVGYNLVPNLQGSMKWLRAAILACNYDTPGLFNEEVVRTGALVKGRH